MRNYYSVSAALRIIAFVLFLCGALNVKSKYGLVAFGLAAWVLATLV